MANIRLLFQGSPSAECFEKTIEFYTDEKGLLVAEIIDHENEDNLTNSQFTCLDRSTAIKLCKELRLQISLMEE